MPRLLKSVFLIFFLLFFCSSFLFAEDITVTTYYPSPYGVYRQLTWGNFPNTRGALTAAEGSSIELGGQGTPYIDFSNDMVSDFDMRIILTGDDSLQIDGGNLGIGTPTPGAFKLYVNGPGHLQAAAWDYASDRRLKENIRYIQSGLAIIKQLKPVKFDYIKGDKKQTGFIAQEVEKVLPDIITKGPDGMLGMKTESIIPYLVKAIQEQQEEINSLKAKLAAKK